MRVQAGIAAAAFLAAACSLPSRKVGSPEVLLSKAPGAYHVGAAACFACHAEIPAAIAESVHGPLDLRAYPGSALCESCHGPGSAHVVSMDGADVVGREDLAGIGDDDRSRLCLACHETMATRFWSHSAHAGRDVSCWDCHEDGLHFEHEDAVDPAPLDSVPDGGRFCFQCHVEVEQEFQNRERHGVTQGRMECTSCHGPHGEEGKVETAGDDVCTTCHVEVAGPWIFEHEAVREGCTSCHEPHGSPNEKLLVAEGNGLCLECHVDSAYPGISGTDHSAYLGSGAECFQCHFEVHGSNTSEIFAPGW